MDFPWQLKNLILECNFLILSNEFQYKVTWRQANYVAHPLAKCGIVNPSSRLSFKSFLLVGGFDNNVMAFSRTFLSFFFKNRHSFISHRIYIYHVTTVFSNGYRSRFNSSLRDHHLLPFEVN